MKSLCHSVVVLLLATRRGVFVWLNGVWTLGDAGRVVLDGDDVRRRYRSTNRRGQSCRSQSKYRASPPPPIITLLVPAIASLLSSLPVLQATDPNPPFAQPHAATQQPTSSTLRSTLPISRAQALPYHLSANTITAPERHIPITSRFVRALLMTLSLSALAF